MNPKNLNIAYLVSKYPAISHTFIAREVRYLKAQGAHLAVASINVTDIADDQLTPEDRKELEHTFYVKKKALGKCLSALFYGLYYFPRGFFQGFRIALCLGQWDLKQHLFWIFYFLEALIVGKWMHEQQLDHVHVHFANPASSVALLLKKIFSFGLSLTVHGPDEFYDVTSNALAEKISAANFICCISYYAQSQLMRLSPESEWHKFEVTRLGVNPTLYSPEERQPIVGNVLCVGRLAASKGHFMLIEAIHSLIQQQIHVTLTLVGDGPFKKCLEKKVRHLGLEKHVTFCGALNSQQTLAHYQKADVFALASFAEGIPVVLMEAMSMEIPCVSTSINGIPELIEAHHNGLLVPPSDTKSLADAIGLLCKDRTVHETLAKAGRRTILEKYHFETNTAVFFNLLKRNYMKSEAK